MTLAELREIIKKTFPNASLSSTASFIDRVLIYRNEKNFPMIMVLETQSSFAGFFFSQTTAIGEHIFNGALDVDNIATILIACEEKLGYVEDI